MSNISIINIFINKIDNYGTQVIVHINTFLRKLQSIKYFIGTDVKNITHSNDCILFKIAIIYFSD
jgi:hypothetical protein